MSPKVILLAGAPDPSTINDIPDHDLLSDFTSPLSSYLGLHSSTPRGSNPSQDSTRAAWRSLPLQRRPLDTASGLITQVQAPVYPNIDSGAKFHNDFFSTASGSFPADSTDQTEHSIHGSETSSQQQQQQQVLSQFYNHSLARHQDLPSSQLQPGTQDETSSDQSKTSFSAEASTSSFSTARSSASDDPSTSAAVTPRPPLLPGNAAAPAQLSDLEDIPSAKYLLSVLPATITVNLIAGVISAAAPRTVTTRWGREMSLVELLLGDETRAGFGVTFWLPPPPPPPPPLPPPKDPSVGRAAKPPCRHAIDASATADTLASLRPQDVILLRNVALHVFRGKVYGQSLRGGLTKIHLLYRRQQDRGDGGAYYRLEDLKGGRKRRRTTRRGPRGEDEEKASREEEERRTHPQLEKTTSVWEWVLQFVSGDTDSARRRKRDRDRGEEYWDRGRAKARDPPPDDTQ